MRDTTGVPICIHSSSSVPRSERILVCAHVKVEEKSCVPLFWILEKKVKADWALVPKGLDLAKTLLGFNYIDNT